MSDILWTPKDAAANSPMAQLAQQLGLNPRNHTQLHRWSLQNKNRFWNTVWQRSNIIGEPGDTACIPHRNNDITTARFFPDAKLNLAENLLAGNDEAVVIYAVDETGEQQSITWQRLREMVAQCADGLAQLGIKKGDTIAGIQTNSVEGLVALLAAAAIGAVWTSCSPDFGAVAILERVRQARPKLLFVTPQYLYNGQTHNISARLNEIIASLRDLKAVIICGEGEGVTATVPCYSFSEFGDKNTPLQFTRVPFSHPLYILYTSGTTGAPKAIVHSTGGVLLEHRKEHLLHSDIRGGDVVFWYTNTAWMMYHWLISALAGGAAVVLYDGSPMPRTSAGPDCSALWRMAETLGVTHFGTSPKYVSALAAADYAPGAACDLERLRWVLSSGAPMPPNFFDWLYDNIKRDMIYASVSGGTEIIGCFFLGSPVLPVRRGRLTCKSLGIAAGVMDETGALVVGRQGELVCTEPFPSMPLTFLGDGGDERYRRAYFSARPGVWSHGDLAEETEDGGAIIYGRSDTTLNPGGVRIGTAEIYAACEGLPGVDDFVAFGVPVSGDEEVVLCLRMAAGAVLTAEVAKRVRERIREYTSPRHVPRRIYGVGGVPYTLNGKRVEKAARLAFLGEEAGNESSLADPGCLDDYRALRDSPWL